MTGQEALVRLTAIESQSEKIYTEVAEIRRLYNEGVMAGFTPEVVAQMKEKFDNIDAAQQLTDEVNPDAEPGPTE